MSSVLLLLLDPADCPLPTGCTPPGCRYDDGLQDITNIDFVEAVVRDMMRRNLRQRPRMRWLKMDMTRMDKVQALCDQCGHCTGLKR
jgi:hypothetical protein